MSGTIRQIYSKQLGIGVDYGTSNSVAAVFDGQNVHLVQLESHSAVMPSATYIDRDFQIVTGQAAIDCYIESNTGRTVELSAEVLGREEPLQDKLEIMDSPKKRKLKNFMASRLSIVDKKVVSFAA
ncbi:MAG: hypothetical protein CM1200mP40_08160 [Gammaproteobacteria bacterium]|nr:MAG: hypothetical protein CM1200mP40_08160 [Gammaproteobacteria bacterium]